MFKNKTDERIDSILTRLDTQASKIATLERDSKDFNKIKELLQFSDGGMTWYLGMVDPSITVLGNRIKKYTASSRIVAEKIHKAKK